MAWYDYLNPLAGATEGGRKLGLWGESDAQRIRNKGMAEAQAEQERMGRDMAQRRERDLANTMGFYSPAIQALERLYGIPMSAWGQGLPQNQPPPATAPFGAMPGYKDMFTKINSAPVTNMTRAPYRPLTGMLQQTRPTGFTRAR